MDISQWEGWEIHVRDKRREILIIILRRKYIPPILDSFTDFSFVLYGPPYDNNESNLNMIRNVADSLQWTSNSSNIYQLMVQERANALLLDEDSYAFYQKHLMIKPKEIVIGIQLLVLILKILSKANPS